MKATVERGGNRVSSRQPRPTPDVPELAWLQAMLGLGFAVGLVLLAGFALNSGGAESSARAPTPATPVLAAALPSARVNNASGPNPPPLDEEQAESEVPTPAGGADQQPQPDLTLPPAAEAISPDRPHTMISEDELRRQLRRFTEFGLKPAVRDALAEKYKASYQSNAAMGRKPVFDPGILLSRVPSARQLPLRGFPVCQLSPDRAATLGVLSRALHAYLDELAPRDATGKRGDPTRVREVLRTERRGKPPAWLRPEALPAMVQILMAEGVPLRLILVDMMADIPGRAATVRLAQRAVFDLSPEVRRSAIDALRQRPADEARRTLVDALRYPWPPVADHAAEALTALGDRDAAPHLVALLDKPDPAAPYPTKTGASVHELVRVNHIQNCLLCHVPAVGRDAVTDVDPFTNRPSQTYEVGYHGPSIPGGSGGVWANRVLIRADVQFLHQDFSVTLPVDDTYSAAGGLRFDFLVRTRSLKPAEVREWKYRPLASTYPQREATLSALRWVTGRDAGSKTEAWLELYPHAHAEAEGARLAAALRTARPDQRDQLLARYRDAKDDRFTEGLAHAIPHVVAKFRDKVRAALVERLARLTADELGAYLQGTGQLSEDADSELREAALRALPRVTGAEVGPPTDRPHQVIETAVTR